MKKIIFILVVMCLGFVSCGKTKTEEDIAIQNTLNLKNEIVEKIYNAISKQLKDPSSLKFAEKEELVKKVANPLDIKNNKYISYTYKEGVDYYTIPWVKYYAKNGFGAYDSDYTTLLIAVETINTDKNGIKSYFIYVYDFLYHPDWLNISRYFFEIEDTKNTFYEKELTSKNIHYLLDVSDFIKFPDEIVM